jgi:hypothetical protein
VETIMKVQLGGGTDIGKALSYAATLVENPRLTIIALVTYFFDYAHCDCGQPGPCVHALLAVFAFRQMPAGSQAALIAHGEAEAASNLTLLAEAEQIVELLGQDGIGGIPGSAAGRWKRAATALQKAGLIWLAGLVEDILLGLDRYQNRDALFCPDQLASLSGELLLRSAAMPCATAPGFPGDWPGGGRPSKKRKSATHDGLAWAVWSPRIGNPSCWGLIFRKRIPVRWAS